VPGEWYPGAYERLSDPQYRWGLAVLERIPLRGDETVVDPGCGTGRLTAVLLERLPLGRVIGVDRSQNMLDQAASRLGPRHGERVELVRADLGAFALGRVADLVVSTATFHWVLDHERLFRELFAALRPGGRLVAQSGVSLTTRRGARRTLPSRSTRGAPADRRPAPWPGCALPRAARTRARRRRGTALDPSGSDA